MSENPLDERYPTIRELLDVRERVTSLEGFQANISATLNRIESRQLTSPVDHGALASHRVIQELPQTLSQALAAALQDSKRNSSNASPFTTVLSYVGAAAVAGLSVYVFLHH